MLTSDQTASSNFIDQFKLDTNHNWDDLRVRFKNQHTRTYDNFNRVREGSIFAYASSEIFALLQAIG